MFQVTLISVLFLIVGAIYLLSILIIYAGLRNTDEFIPSGQNFTTRVTVIIPARNEERNILNCLNDLLEQDYPNELLQIIVVDDGSTDKTPELILEFAANHPTFPLVPLHIEPEDQQAGGKKGAIKRAMDYASGELILTTDADTHMGKQWIAATVACFERYRPGMILGPVAFTGKPGIFSSLQACEFMGLMAVTEGSCNLGRPLMCNGANLAYAKSAFDAVGGFEDNQQIPSGDDMFLMMKIRKKFGKESVRFLRSVDAIIRTEPSSSLCSFLQQRLRWVSKSRGYSDATILSVAIITYLFNAMLFVGFVTGFFSHPLWAITGALLVAKILVEFPLLVLYAGFLRRKDLLKWIPLVQLLNIFYVTFVGLAGNFVSYKWKGRSVSPIVKP